MAKQPYPSEGDDGWWNTVAYEAFDNEYKAVGRYWPDDRQGFAWPQRVSWDTCEGMTKEAALAKHVAKLRKDLSPPPPVGAVCPVPILGQLRRQGNMLAHDAGLCTPQFSSEFPMLRVFRHNREMYERLKYDLIRYRLQGSREFTNVGGWMGFWAPNNGVYATTFTPWYFDRKDGHLRPATDGNGNNLYGPQIQAWPDYDQLLGELIEDFARAKLALHFVTGDCQILYCDIVNGRPIYRFEKELEHHRRVARIVRDTSKPTVSLYELRNEYPINSPFGGSSRDHQDMERLIQEVKAIFGSDVLCGKGAALSEEPEQLQLSARGGDVCFVHVTREWPMCLKRTLGLWYWEGTPGAFGVPYVHGEPKPGNIPPFNDGVGDDGYMATDRVDQLIALHTMIALTGAAGNIFTGASVKLDTYPSLMPGFQEIPVIIEEHIPEDIATWGRATAGNGAILYFVKDKQFATSTDETWNTQPPRAVASWKMYTGRGLELETLEGTGAPPQGRTGFIVGRFV